MEKPMEKRMPPIKLDQTLIERATKPEYIERAMKPEPAYKEVVEGMKKQIAETFTDPSKTGTLCCIQGCCVSWCCVQLS